MSSGLARGDPFVLHLAVEVCDRNVNDNDNDNDIDNDNANDNANQGLPNAHQPQPRPRPSDKINNDSSSSKVLWSQPTLCSAILSYLDTADLLSAIRVDWATLYLGRKILYREIDAEAVDHLFTVKTPMARFEEYMTLARHISLHGLCARLHLLLPLSDWYAVAPQLETVEWGDGSMKRQPSAHGLAHGSGKEYIVEYNVDCHDLDDVFDANPNGPDVRRYLHAQALSRAQGLPSSMGIPIKVQRRLALDLQYSEPIYTGVSWETWEATIAKLLAGPISAIKIYDPSYEVFPRLVKLLQDRCNDQPLSLPIFGRPVIEIVETVSTSCRRHDIWSNLANLGYDIVLTIQPDIGQTGGASPHWPEQLQTVFQAASCMNTLRIEPLPLVIPPPIDSPNPVDKAGPTVFMTTNTTSRLERIEYSLRYPVRLDDLLRDQELLQQMLRGLETHATMFARLLLHSTERSLKCLGFSDHYQGEGPGSWWEYDQPGVGSYRELIERIHCHMRGLVADKVAALNLNRGS